jgi:hypothetical protein
MSKLKIALIISVGVVSFALNGLRGSDTGFIGTMSLVEDEVSAETVFEANKRVAEEWVDGLAEKECKDCPPLFKRIDDNGKYSYSCLQYQEATFVADVKYYDLLPYAEDQEIMNWIYDCQFQKQLAVVTILDNPKYASKWRTTVEDRGYGYPQFIKETDL